MRVWFHEQLDELRGLIVVAAASVTSSIRWATDALLDTNLETATEVQRVAAELKQSKARADRLIHQLLVRHQPVASDLRLALSSLHVIGDLERMAALSEHIAEIAVLRHPDAAVPFEVVPVVRQMGTVAEQLAWTVTRVLEVGDTEAAGRLERDDDVMDDLHKEMFEILFRSWDHGVRAAVDLALIARFYERYADHAVNAGHQVVFLALGEHPPA